MISTVNIFITASYITISITIGIIIGIVGYKLLRRSPFPDNEDIDEFCQNALRTAQPLDKFTIDFNLRQLEVFANYCVFCRNYNIKPQDELNGASICDELNENESDVEVKSLGPNGQCANH